MNEKRVISYSLWGKDPMYTIGAIKNATLCIDIFPGWVCRFYVDKTVPEDIINELKNLGSEIIYKQTVIGYLALMWRFEPMFDNTVSAFIVRDTDARLDLREKNIVDYWLCSGKNFHIIRDHPNHRWEIMGGMWGGRSNVIKTFKNDFDKYFNNPPPEGIVFRGQKYFSYDQTFLKEKLWPYIINDHIAHDEFYRPTGKELPFIDKRNDKTHFVGQKYTYKDEPVFWI